MKRVLALALVCLLPVACGGEGDSDDASSLAPRAIEPEAQERAESLVLTLSDFPDGWRAGASEEDEADDEAFNDCVGADFSAFTIVGEAESDDFAMGEATEASSLAQVFETEEAAAAAVAEFAQAWSSDAANSCLSDFLVGEFEDDEFEITGVELGELSFTPPPGLDDASAWQVAVTFEGKAGTQADGVSATGYVDRVLLRKGDATADIRTGDVLTPFDPVLRDELVAAVAERLSE